MMISHLNLYFHYLNIIRKFNSWPIIALLKISLSPFFFHFSTCQVHGWFRSQSQNLHQKFSLNFVSCGSRFFSSPFSSFQPINYNCLYHLAIHSCFFNSAPLSSVSVQGELRKEVGTLTLLEGDPGVRTSGRWGRGEGRKMTHAYNVVSFFNSHHTKKFSYIIYSEWATWKFFGEK